MITRTLIRLPQHSANDTDAVLVAWFRETGECVAPGTPLYTAETTKAVFDVDAEADGYVTHLVDEGERVAIGAPVAVISSEPDDINAIRQWLQEQTPEQKHPQTITGTRTATKKAEILAKKMGIDLASVPATGDRITEADVLVFSEKRVLPVSAAPVRKPALRFRQRDASKIERLLLIGGANNAVQIIDALAGSSYQKAVLSMDDNVSLQGTNVVDVPVIGPVSLEKALELFRADEIDAAVVAIGSVAVRARLYTEWSAAGIPFGTIIHPTVHIGTEAAMGEGNVIMAFSQLGPYSTLGDNNFFSAYTNIEHHCTVGSHCSFGPGIFFSGIVSLGDRVRLGTGIHVEPCLSIGSDTVIASGVSVTGNIPPDSLVKSRAGYAVRKRRP